MYLHIWACRFDIYVAIYGLLADYIVNALVTCSLFVCVMFVCPSWRIYLM